MKDKRLDELYQYIEEHEEKWRIDHLKRYEYEDRINEAIDYMQENYNELTDYGYKEEIYDDLLNILQGSEK